MKENKINCLDKFPAFFLILFLIFGEASSQVLWYGDPDKNIKDLFRRFDTEGAGKDYCATNSEVLPIVTRPNDSKYGKVWKISKPINRKRAEFARTSYVPQEGQTYYYGWRWKITANTAIQDDITVWQWKTDHKGGLNFNKQHYPLNLEYKENELFMNAFGPGHPNWTQDYSEKNKRIKNRRTTIWRKRVKRGEWISIIIKMKLSRSANEGYVEVYFNGEKQLLTNSDFDEYLVSLSKDRKRAYHRTFDGFREVYPKWGAYNSNACNYDISTYYDEMRIARDLESANPECY